MILCCKRILKAICVTHTNDFGTNILVSKLRIRRRRKLSMYKASLLHRT